MFEQLTSIFTFDFSSWISEVVSLFTTAYEDTEGNLIETIHEIPWSALIPWTEVFSFVTLIVFICLVFKLLRSVLCKAL